MNFALAFAIGAGGYALALGMFIFVWAKLFEPERRLRDQRNTVNRQFVRLHPDLDKAESEAVTNRQMVKYRAIQAAKQARVRKALEVVK